MQKTESNSGEGKKWMPLPGNVFVKLESYFKNAGPIHVPQSSDGRPHIMGEVVAVNMRQEDRCRCGVEIEPGMRVIVWPAAGIPIDLEQNLWKFPLAIGKEKMGLHAIIGKDVDLQVHVQEIERCKFCGDAKGSGQGVILQNGKCPRCGKNQYGVIPDDAPKVSDAEVEEFWEMNRKHAV